MINSIIFDCPTLDDYTIEGETELKYNHYCKTFKCECFHTPVGQCTTCPKSQEQTRILRRRDRRAMEERARRKENDKR